MGDGDVKRMEDNSKTKEFGLLKLPAGGGMWRRHMNSTALVGTWTLESWELVDSKGAVDHPFGRTPVGYIMYGPEGHMSVEKPEMG